MNALKELDEVMTSLWYQAEISDEAKLYWNDMVKAVREKRENNA